MQRNTKRIVGKGVVCLLCFLLGGVATLGITWHLLGQDGRTLLQAHQLIEKRFVGEYDPAENLSATLETMVDSLGDRWSYYLDPEEAQRTREARSNAYVGIGVTVSQEPSDGLEIVGVTAGSPAQEAGLQVGEIIRAVDGQAIQPETREEAVETTKIYSIAGQLPQGRGLISARPFRSPHHSASAAALAGGGAQFRPGECSLANCGVLFLDELPEFSRESLEVLRQPLEDGQITVSRAAGNATYPSHFQLVAAMNPCKCGYYGHPTRQCTCSPSAVRQYRSRVSGPLLDRIDLCVEMDPIAFDELHTAAPSESSAELRKQVLAARAIQAKRYAAPGFKGVHCNAQLNAGQVRRICRMTPGAEQLLRSSYDALGLSARAHDRILRVARTVADLAGKPLLDEDSLLEALQYRAQEKLDG